MRGAWHEHEKPEFLAGSAEAFDGPTRSVTDGGTIGRFLGADTGSREYATAQTA